MKLIHKVTFPVQSCFLLRCGLSSVIIFHLSKCDSTLQCLMKSGLQEKFLVGSVLRIFANSRVEMKTSFLYMAIK
jgi:hypothetical protein